MLDNKLVEKKERIEPVKKTCNKFSMGRRVRMKHFIKHI